MKKPTDDFFSGHKRLQKSMNDEFVIKKSKKTKDKEKEILSVLEAAYPLSIQALRT